MAAPQWPDRKAMLSLERKKGTTNSQFDANMSQWRGLMNELDQVWRLLKGYEGFVEGRVQVKELNKLVTFLKIDELAAMHDKQAVRWILLREDITKKKNSIKRMIMTDEDLQQVSKDDSVLEDGKVDVEKFLDWWT